MYSIDRMFDCCYGHRIHSQTLNSLFSLTTTCKCRRLHGHQMKLKIGLRSDKLKNGMVTDFTHLAWVKSIIDGVIDHRFIMDSHDPMLPMLFKEVVDNPTCLEDHGHFKTVATDYLERVLPDSELKSVIIEKCSSLVLVDFLPTSENLCKWFYDMASEEMDEFAKAEGFRVAYVEFWETPKSHCRYEPND